jgi:uncharacterized protein YeaO (DUF488 family)
MSAAGPFVVKRVYEEVSQEDGLRVLVDRLWPRGMTKEAAHLDDWRKNLAPSSALRTWFGHDPKRFTEFTSRYERELASNAEVDAFLEAVAGKKRVSLLYAAKDPAVNHAIVLRTFLQSRRGNVP